MISQLVAKCWLTTIIVSLLPNVELRLVIPVVVSLCMPVWNAVRDSIVGNLVPDLFIIALIQVFMDWLSARSKFMKSFHMLEKSATGQKAERVKHFEFLGLLLFVAILLPGTGAWTGALVASLLDIRMKRNLPPIIVGMLITAVFVSPATAVVVVQIFA